MDQSPGLWPGALALAVVLGGCAATGSVPRPFPAPGGWPEPPSGASGTRADAGSLPRSTPGALVVGTALELRGVPYRNGGTDPNGFDCSGFTQYVFGQHGLALPREVRDQFTMGTSVKPADLEAGDLLFFATGGRGVSHVAISVGGDAFVHAPSSEGVVRVESLSSSYWARRFRGARRIAD